MSFVYSTLDNYSHCRKALRIARLAEVVASVAGWDYTFKAMKYAYLSKDLIGMLIGADFGNALVGLFHFLL